MMLIVTALAAAAAGAAVPQKTVQSTQQAQMAPVCQQVGVHKTAPSGKADRRRTHNLSKEPPAKELKAVLYTEGDCAKPIVVREQVGNTPQR